MTASQLKHGVFLGFLMLINPIFWGTAIAGAAMPVASYSLTQAAEGRELYAEHCASWSSCSSSRRSSSWLSSSNTACSSLLPGSSQAPTTALWKSAADPAGALC